MRGGGGGGNGEDGRGTQGLSYMIRFLQCPESEGLGRLWTVGHLCQVGLEAVSTRCENKCPLCTGGLPGSHTTSSLLLSWSFSRGTFFPEERRRGLWC